MDVLHYIFQDKYSLPYFLFLVNMMDVLHYIFQTLFCYSWVHKKINLAIHELPKSISIACLLLDADENIPTRLLNIYLNDLAYYSLDEEDYLKWLKNKKRSVTPQVNFFFTEKKEKYKTLDHFIFSCTPFIESERRPTSTLAVFPGNQQKKLDTFPVEILIKVFSYLDIKSLGQISAVSRYMHCISKNIFNTLSLSVQQPTDTLSGFALTQQFLTLNKRRFTQQQSIVLLDFIREKRLSTKEIEIFLAHEIIPTIAQKNFMTLLRNIYFIETGTYVLEHNISGDAHLRGGASINYHC